MSTRLDLKALAARESEQVEWKENVADVLDVVETIVAFANDLANLGGGYVVCGGREIKDENGFQKVELLGMTSSRCKEVEGRVLSTCVDFVNPPLHPVVEELPTEHPDRRVLVFIVAATTMAHTFRRKEDGGIHYVRIGRETKQARNGVLLNLLVRKGAQEPWDRRIHTQATVDDLDLLALRDFLVRIERWDDIEGVDPFLRPATPLSQLVPPLIGREPLSGAARPRNFALLLFAREPHRFFPDAHVLFSRYPGVDRSEDCSERLEIGGTLPQQAARLVDLLKGEAIVVMDKRDFDRPNQVRYPIRALQEAAINAIAHRDYAAFHPIRVTAFADRIEIRSPGGLPLGVTSADFASGRVGAAWRNQGLAWVMNRLGLAQAEGQGIQTIRRSMEMGGCPPPEFSVDGEWVTCVLRVNTATGRGRVVAEAEDLHKRGRTDEALRRVADWLEGEPGDPRALQALADLSLAAWDVDHVIRFVESHASLLKSLPAATLWSLASVLDRVGARNRKARSRAVRLYQQAVLGRLTASQLRIAARALVAGGNEVDAIGALSRHAAEDPSLSTQAWFLELRGRAALRIAREAAEEAEQFFDLPDERREAVALFRNDLATASDDLRAAASANPDEGTRRLIERGLRAVEDTRSEYSSLLND